MTHQTSFHGLDAALVGERLVPWLLGATPDDALDDLFMRAAQLRHTHHRVLSWTIGALQSGVQGIEPNVHLTGRPWLVTGKDAPTRREQIDRWLNIPPHDVDAYAQELLAPFGRCEPATLPSLPSVEKLFDPYRDGFVALRLAVRQAQAGQADAATLSHLPHAVLTLQSVFAPGWFDAGPTWPSHRSNGSDVQDRFVANIAMVMPIIDALPDAPWTLRDTIDGAWQVGGCLPQEALPDLVAHLGHEPEHRLLVEAAEDAILRGHPLVEATDVYAPEQGLFP